jgi:hypothetical protein
MTRYASSDITSFTNKDCPEGGHSRKIVNGPAVRRGAEPEYEERLIIDCAFCEPLLTKKDSWSGDPSDIPLTPSEKAAATALEKQGLKDTALMAQALAEVARDKVASGR